MAYVNYWHWKTPIADADKFAEWSSDSQYLLDELSMPERELPPYTWGRWPSASQGGYTPVFYRTHISGPSGRGEAVITPTKVAFNGNASLGEACEPFVIRLRDLKTPKPLGSCKTRMEPYDLLVICALVRLAHYFPEVFLSSDGGAHPIQVAVQICREVFGDNRLPRVDYWQDEEDSFLAKWERASRERKQVDPAPTSWVSHTYLYPSRIAEFYLIFDLLLS